MKRFAVLLLPLILGNCGESTPTHGTVHVTVEGFPPTTRVSIAVVNAAGTRVTEAQPSAEGTQVAADPSDLLLVWAPGCDVARVNPPLAPNVKVELHVTTDTAVVRLVDGDGSAVHLIVERYVRDPIDPARSGVFLDGETIELVTSARLRLPRGFTTAVFPKSKGSLVWPPVISPRPGQEVEVYVSPTVSVRPPPSDDLPIDNAYYMIDYAHPPSGDKEWIDAIMSHASRPIASVAPDRTTIVDLPPAPVHIFVRRQRRVEYFHVEPRMPLATSSESVVGLRSVQVDGEGAPAGAFIYPGLLDLNSAAMASSLSFHVIGMGTTVKDKGIADFPMIRADRFTLFLPEGRIAHLRSKPDGTLSGTWLEGRIRIAFADGMPEGELNVWSVLVGTGRVRSGQHPAPISRRRSAGTKQLVLENLPLGNYELRWKAVDGSESVATAEITAASKTVDVSVPRR